MPTENRQLQTANHKERPILFSTPMVQALLEGRKTQTRRVVKYPAEEYLLAGLLTDYSVRFIPEPAFNHLPYKYVKCPYGKPGDLLWVRESFCFNRFDWKDLLARGSKAGISFKADQLSKNKLLKWKPSIHMPKAAARIWLRVTEVRVERLQEITEADAKAEGVENIMGTHYSPAYANYSETANDCPYFINPRHSFNSLWQSIHGPESWQANPWVWVVSFEVVSTTGKPEFSPKMQTRL